MGTFRISEISSKRSQGSCLEETHYLKKQLVAIVQIELSFFLLFSFKEKNRVFVSIDAKYESTVLDV